MFNQDGVLIDSGRPLVENLLDAKMARRAEFWFYMELLMHDASIRREGSNIYVSCGTPLELYDGGEHESE